MGKRKHPCQDCGVQISFCAKRCRSCNSKYLWSIGKIAPHGMPRGEKHRGWKGGRYRKDGYIFKMAPEHPKANKDGYVREHILVWEKYHRNKLPDKWVIHHLNGIKDDNRPCNLIALPDMKHKRILDAKAKRIQELEAILNGQIQLI